MWIHFHRPVSKTVIAFQSKGTLHVHLAMYCTVLYTYLTVINPLYKIVNWFGIFFVTANIYRNSGNPVEAIKEWLPRLHSVVIGPGLGRLQSVLDVVKSLIADLRARSIPIVIDAVSYKKFWSISEIDLNINILWFLKMPYKNEDYFYSGISSWQQKSGLLEKFIVILYFGFALSNAY